MTLSLWTRQEICCKKASTGLRLPLRQLRQLILPPLNQYTKETNVKHFLRRSYDLSSPFLSILRWWCWDSLTSIQQASCRTVQELADKDETLQSSDRKPANTVSRNFISSGQQRTEGMARASRLDFCHYLPDRFIWAICSHVSRIAEDIFCVPFAMIKFDSFSLQMSRNRSTSFVQDFRNTFSRCLPSDLNRNIAVSCSPLAHRNFASSIFHDQETPRSSPSSRVCIAAMPLCSCRIRNKAFSATYGILMLLNRIKTKSINFFNPLKKSLTGKTRNLCFCPSHETQTFKLANHNSKRIHAVGIKRAKACASELRLVSR